MPAHLATRTNRRPATRLLVAVVVLASTVGCGSLPAGQVGSAPSALATASPAPITGAGATTVAMASTTSTIATTTATTTTATAPDSTVTGSTGQEAVPDPTSTVLLSRLPYLLPSVPPGTAIWHYDLPDPTSAIYKQVWFEPGGSRALQIAWWPGAQVAPMWLEPFPAPEGWTTAVRTPTTIELYGPDGALAVIGNGVSDVDLEAIASTVRPMPGGGLGWTSPTIPPELVPVVAGDAGSDLGPSRMVYATTPDGRNLSLLTTDRSAEAFSQAAVSLGRLSARPGAITPTQVNGNDAFVLSYAGGGYAVVWQVAGVGRLLVLPSFIGTGDDTDEGAAAVSAASSIRVVDAAEFTAATTPIERPDGCGLEVAFNHC